jgi:glycosyltransferase involved in cell wall biosynthesis
MVMARSRAIRRALVLNAPRAAEELNRLYRTRKFVALADPVPSVDKTKLRDLRTELGISADTQTFLHFGAMGERKGTLDILQAILLLPTSEHKTFIFAGRVGEEIKKEFYNLVGKCRAVGAKILVRDEFCSYELINSLCYTADCLLAPYHLTSLSSGVIGYASVIGTPVIGPADGLIGELIRDNNLGLTISEVTPEQIARAISDFTPTHASSAYAAANTIESFQKTFLE